MSVFLSFLISFGFCRVKDFCVAPTANIEPLDSSYKMKYSFLIFRHGSRAPDSLFLPRDHRGSQWQCNDDNAQLPQIESIPLNNPRRVRKVKDTNFIEYPPNCAKGELTTEGQQEEYDLGKSYREYFVDKLHYLPEEFDPSVMEIRSSHKDRTYRSTVSFLLGMYPVLYPNEYFNIQMGGDVIDPFDPSTTECGDLANSYANFSSTDEFHAIHQEVINNVSEILSWTNVPVSAMQQNAYSLDVVCDFITTLECNDVPFPSNIPQNAVDTCVNFVPYMMIGMFANNPGIGASRTARFMKKSVDRAINGETPYKISLVGCHDSTLLAYSILLGYQPIENPPYASHILTEIYEKDSTLYVRVLFNNKVLPINGKDIITYAEWKSILSQGDAYCLHDYTVESFANA